MSKIEGCMSRAAGGLLGLLTVVGGLLGITCAHTVTEQACQDRVARAVATMAARHASAAVVFDDKKNVEQVLTTSMEAVPGAVYVAVLKPDGTVLAALNPGGTKPPGLDTLRQGQHRKESTVWVAVPILSQVPGIPAIDPGTMDTGAVLEPDEQGPTREQGAVVEGPKTRPGSDQGAVLDDSPTQGSAEIGWLVIGYRF